MARPVLQMKGSAVRPRAVVVANASPKRPSAIFDPILDAFGLLIADLTTGRGGPIARKRTLENFAAARELEWQRRRAAEAKKDEESA